MIWEFNILNYIAQFRNNFLDSIMVLISVINNYGYIWISITLLLLCSRKYRAIGLTCALALIIMQISGNMIMKPIINRIRPFEINNIALLISTPNGSSFPSGHTYSSFASATAIFMWNRKWGMAAFVLAALIGFSRLYLYVHFPTDVLSAAVFGIADGVICYFIVKKFYFDKKYLTK